LRIPFRRPRTDDREKSRGQSLVELALVVPVILLLLLIALDFGRAYLGWVNLNQMARIAANYAALNPDAAFADPTGPYQVLVKRDSRATNCDLLPAGPVDTVPTPDFSSGKGLGAPVRVDITCQFSIITPIISSIVGNAVQVSASSTFPVRSGAVADIPTGGAVSNIPVADFIASPQSGNAPLIVSFTDLSANAPLTWQWSFGDGGTSTMQHPTHTYTTPGTYTVSLTVSNPAGTDPEVKTAYITVAQPPTGLTADFTAGPSVSGPAPLTVTFTDASTGGSPVAWTWNFGNGQTASTQGPHTVTYSSPGSYSVSLQVSDGIETHSVQKIALVNVGVSLCDVPNVSDKENKDEALVQLATAGFTNVVADGPTGNWKVKSQVPAGGFIGYPCADLVTISSK
jgi:PKD repeat protein